MTKTRSELRRICMTILYQYDLFKKDNIDINELIKDNLEVDNDFVKDLVYGVVTHQNEIDEIEKLGSSILRMAIFEIKYTDTPDIVAINEALELAKVYCDDSLKNIINAVLDKVIKE